MLEFDVDLNFTSLTLTALPAVASMTTRDNIALLRLAQHVSVKTAVGDNGQTKRH